MSPEFQLDPFQQEAIAWIRRNHSVLISAPTGSGKTLIAESAIDQALANQETVIYTAPIKALSNQKYRDFRAGFGDERVGILTGDVAINPDAEIVIMTTEIYRNSLFESAERFSRLGWVIFDEIHYLDDAERGTVWEEALLFTPSNIKLLALSATIPNIQELANWIRKTHPERPLEIITETNRPVPLHFLYQCQGRILPDSKQLMREGYLNRGSWRLSFKEKRRGLRMPKPKPNRLEPLLEHLRNQKRLPVIYFVFGRRRAEELAWDAAPYDFLNEDERKKIITRYDELLAKYDLTRDKSAGDLRPLIEQGIAFHHAGMLPTIKEVIEQLFTSRLIKVIFTTETFALGINMPARSVVLDELEKFYGTGFRTLTTRDFYQMAGRAGRRGLDPEGFVYVRINPFQIRFEETQRILFGKPERVESQFNTTYATLLNLYEAHGVDLIKIYPDTFHYFQANPREQKMAYQMIQNKLRLLEELDYIQENALTPKGEFAASVFGYELLLSEMHEAGYLDQLDEYHLCTLLAALVFEPRKGTAMPCLTKPQNRLFEEIRGFSKRIFKAEHRLRILPYTKLPQPHLSNAVEAWARGSDFDKLFSLTDVDEGELVRYLRMTIQLLRELALNPHSSESLRNTARNARTKIDRGVVDAEKQLRV